jgi:hypothetical protein
LSTPILDLPIGDSSIADCRLPIADFQIANYRLQIADN